MENKDKGIEDIFITAKIAKVKTDILVREQERTYREKAIEFLNTYNFNEKIEKACREMSRTIPSIKIGQDRQLAYAVRNLLAELGYSAKVIIFCDCYQIEVNWLYR